jgi:two-component system, chemotaxis family, protein-glutamate methylesterase/glutaminase
MIELKPQPADDVIVIGTSTGGLQALQTLVAGLPARLPAAVLVVMHVGQHETMLPGLLARVAKMPLRHASHNEPLLPGRILVAPPDQHLTVERSGGRARVALTRTARENHARPAIDVLFRSAAATFGPRAIGVVLTGRLDDGTLGLFAIKACGGRAVVQLPEDAVAADMPASALRHVEVDRVLRLEEIAPALTSMVEESAPLGGERAGAANPAFVPDWLQMENRFAAKGSDMESLAGMASPSTFTCPECHGTLFEMHGPGPKRYRCHTGHALTQRALAGLQDEMVENAVWSALRALQEKEKLLREMAEHAVQSGLTQAALEHIQQAVEAQRSSEVLRRLMAAGQRPADAAAPD